MQNKISSQFESTSGFDQENKFLPESHFKTNYAINLKTHNKNLFESAQNSLQNSQEVMFSSNNRFGIMDNVILNNHSMFNNFKNRTIMKSKNEESRSVLPRHINKTVPNSQESSSRVQFNPNIKIHDESVDPPKIINSTFYTKKSEGSGRHKLWKKNLITSDRLKGNGSRSKQITILANYNIQNLKKIDLKRRLRA